MNKIYQKQKGAALMIFLIFFLIGSSSLTFALARTIYSDLLTQKLLADSTQSYLAADSGVEDMAYRFVLSMNVDASETVSIGGADATTEFIFDSLSDKYDIVGVGIDNDAYRSSSMELFTGSGASFNFGVQTGNGGFDMDNNSWLQGNVFSNGSIVGGNNSEIRGDVISAGPSGLIDSVKATGTARAHTIQNTEIGGDAYAYNLIIGSANVTGAEIGGNVEAYSVDLGASGKSIGGNVIADTVDDGQILGDLTAVTILNGTTVGGGTTMVGSVTPPADQATTSMPITDADIDDIKQDIIDNGTVIASTSPECTNAGMYSTSSNITLGFVKIDCDVEFVGTATITLDGPLWVSGDLTFRVSGLTIQADPAIGARTVPVIVDNEANRLTSSRITVANTVQFNGSGSPKSYILLISQNESAENSGTEAAIDLTNSANGDILVYAGHGLVKIGNSIALKEVTAYQVDLGQGANVTYESGLVNLLFTSGPGGGFTIGSWGEVY